MKKRILLIGGGGFLGKEIRKQLNNRFDVFYTSRTPEDERGIKLSLDDDVEFEVSNFDAVVYNAAHLPRPQNLKTPICKKVNFDSAVKAFESFKFNCKKFIYISTTAIFESNVNVIYEETSSTATCDYSVSKKNAEDFLLTCESGCSIGILRPGTIYGDSMNSDRILPFMIEQAKEKVDFDVINPDTLLHVVHVDDVVKSIEKMIDDNSTFCCNLVSETLSKLDLANMIKKNYGIIENFEIKDYNKRSSFDNRKFIKLIGKDPISIKEYLDGQESRGCLW